MNQSCANWPSIIAKYLLQGNCFMFFTARLKWISRQETSGSLCIGKRLNQGEDRKTDHSPSTPRMRGNARSKWYRESVIDKDVGFSEEIIQWVNTF